MEDKVVYKELSFKIVGILFEVDNKLGYGLQEKVYQKAIEELLIREKIPYQRETFYRIIFEGKEIGKRFLDFLIDDEIVLEIKKGNHFTKNSMQQIKEYLNITNKKLGILANFTPTGVRFFRILNIK